MACFPVLTATVPEKAGELHANSIVKTGNTEEF